MSAHSEAGLQQALAMSHQLLELVNAGEMEQAAKLEATRFRLIRQGLADDPVNSSERRIELLREIQALDREIESVGRREHERLALRLRDMSKGRKAGRAYLQER